jgi:hypothetical protein
MSTIAEHSIDHGHYIQFHSSFIPATKMRHMDCIENRVLKRIFGPKWDGVMGGWRKLHNEELHN